MTIFDSKQQSSPMTIEEGKAFETLVGDGKKFKDQEALAKGKLESDQFIARLQAELEEARNEVKSRLTLEDAIAEIKASATKQAPSNLGNTNPGQQEPPTHAPKQLSPEELDALLEAKLNQRQALTQAQRNHETVKHELTKAWGANAQAILKEKVRSLDMSEQDLDALAARAPAAFLKLVGANETPAPQQQASPPRTSVNSAAASKGTFGDKTWSYYQKMLRENPSQYHSKDTQLEIYKQSMALGADFYK